MEHRKHRYFVSIVDLFDIRFQFQCLESMFLFDHLLIIKGIWFLRKEASSCEQFGPLSRCLCSKYENFCFQDLGNGRKDGNGLMIKFANFLSITYALKVLNFETCVFIGLFCFWSLRLIDSPTAIFFSKASLQFISRTNRNPNSHKYSTEFIHFSYT